jgi:hypothetical protein
LRPPEQPQVNLWVTITVVNQADGDTSTISFNWLIQDNPNLEPPLPATGHEHTHTGGDGTTINDGGSGTTGDTGTAGDTNGHTGDDGTGTTGDDNTYTGGDATTINHDDDGTTINDGDGTTINDGGSWHHR